MGGPKLYNFVSINLAGPSTDAVSKWRKVHMVKLKPGLLEDNFQQLPLLIKSFTKKYGTLKVSWLLAEDETSIDKIGTYHQETDELVGLCGIETGNPKEHICLTEIQVS